MQLTQNEQLVVDFFKVLSSGDLEKLRDYFTNESSWETMILDVPGAGAHKGQTGIIDGFLGPIRGLFCDGEPKVHIDRIVGRDNMVYAETHAVGRVRANNKEYRNRYCWAFELSGSRILAVREYMDSHYVMRTLFDQ